jgi:hypothetical protein
MNHDTRRTVSDRVRAWDAHASYIDSIIAVGQMLAGVDMTDDPEEYPTWQSLAQRQARVLRRYAQFLDDCADGKVRGPIVFPAWKED